MVVIACQPCASCCDVHMVHLVYLATLSVKATVLADLCKHESAQAQAPPSMAVISVMQAPFCMQILPLRMHTTSSCADLLRHMPKCLVNPSAAASRPKRGLSGSQHHCVLQRPAERPMQVLGDLQWSGIEGLQNFNSNGVPRGNDVKPSEGDYASQGASLHSFGYTLACAGGVSCADMTVLSAWMTLH